MLTLRRESSRLRFSLQDILAVMVGYALAALLFRAYWPTSRPPIQTGIPAVGFYLWLGMAMSGPSLLLRRVALRNLERPDLHRLNREPPTQTWAEMAWMLIGAYWIVIGLCVIPARLPAFRLGDMVIFCALSPLLVMTLRHLGQTRTLECRAKHAWTHLVAVVLVATWPMAWLCLIILGRSLH